MAETKLSERMQRLAEALRGRPTRAQLALCGFDLWIEAMGSGHVKGRDMTTGGRFVDGDADVTLKVPVPVLGGRTVIQLDPTLPPDEFLLKP